MRKRRTCLIGPAHGSPMSRVEASFLCNRAMQRLPTDYHYSSAKTSSCKHQEHPKREGEKHAAI